MPDNEICKHIYIVLNDNETYSSLEGCHAVFKDKDGEWKAMELDESIFYGSGHKVVSTHGLIKEDTMEDILEWEQDNA